MTIGWQKCLSSDQAVVTLVCVQYSLKWLNWFGEIMLHHEPSGLSGVLCHHGYTPGQAPLWGGAERKKEGPGSCAHSNCFGEVHFFPQNSRLQLKMDSGFIFRKCGFIFTPVYQPDCSRDPHYLPRLNMDLSGFDVYLFTCGKTTANVIQLMYALCNLWGRHIICVPEFLLI